jgi:hypothetical protein
MEKNMSVLLAVLVLSGCVSTPTGPSAMVLPGTGKNFDQFRADDLDCRQFAQAQVGGNTPDNAALDSGARSAALGTALGGVAGAVIDGSRGAAVGAGAGLLVGGLAGTGAGAQSAHVVQRRYDYAYEQCMYAKGHKIPVTGRFASQVQPPRYAPPPPPPPPPGLRR